MSDPVSKIRVVPLADLRPDPLNANKGSERGTEALEESLQEDGAGRGILLDAEGTIIAGNKTAQKARELGFERVLVVPTDGKTLVATQRIDVPAGSLQAKRMGVRDNRVAEVSMTWDAAVLDALGKDGVDLASMWTESELEALLAGGEQEGAGSEAQGDPDELPENAPTRCQPGEMWQLGEHRLIVADCRDPQTWERLLAGEKTNGVFTSPPYAEQRKEQYGGVPAGEYVEWWQALQENARQHLAPDGSFFVNIKAHCEDGERSLYVMDLVLAMKRRWGWRYVDELCWVHSGFPGEVFDRFRNAFEPIYHFSVGKRCKCVPENVAYDSENVMRYATETRESMTFDKNHRGGAVRESGKALPRNVLHLPNGGSTSIPGHAATFPVALPEFFVKAFSDAGDLWVDPFLGSGTTLIACEKNGRRAAGCELKPEYADVILARWEKLTGREAVRVE